MGLRCHPSRGARRAASGEPPSACPRVPPAPCRPSSARLAATSRRPSSVPRFYGRALLPTRPNGAGSRIINPESGEIRPVEAAIPRQERVGLHLSVCADQEVGDDPAAVTSLPRTVLPPEAAGERRRFWAERVEADSERTEGVGATLIVRERGSHLGPHHRASNEGTVAIGRAQRLSRWHTKLGVCAQ